MIKAFQQIKLIVLVRLHYKTGERGIMNRLLVKGESWNEHLNNLHQFIKM